MSRLRYLIMPSAEASARQRQVALDHHLETFEHGAFTIHVSKGSEDSIQHCGNDLLIGRVYPRAPFGPPRRAAKLAESDFASDRLFRAFWGDYVLVEGASSGAVAHRSPSGRMPAYFASSASGRVIASDCDLLIAMGFVSGAISWEDCGRHLIHFEPLMEQTALEGVLELLPGSSIEMIGSRLPQSPCWCPWEIDDAAMGRSVDRSALELGRLITDCVQAQVEPFEHILVRVSGGLDSSIVAASLAQHDPRVQLMVLVAGEGDGDERHHARLLAEHLGLPLLEERYGIEDVDLDVASYPELPIPRGRHMAQTIKRISARSVARSDSAILTGYGGDNLFCSLMSVRPIVDRLVATGLVGAARTLNDVARSTDSSIAEALGKTMRFLAARKRAYLPRPNSMFIHPDLASEIAVPPMHPAQHKMTRPLPAKDMHVAMILGALRYVDHIAGPDGATEISPLIAQPIMDFCLGIPSWDWCSDGLDRSIARKAFGDRLPASIARRRSKGGPDAFCYRIVEHRRDQLRDRLLEGELVRNGILERRAIEDCLSGDQPLSSVATTRLLQLSDAEAWARSRLDRASPETPAKSSASWPSA